MRMNRRSVQQMTGARPSMFPVLGGLSGSINLGVNCLKLCCGPVRVVGPGERLCGTSQANTLFFMGKQCEDSLGECLRILNGYGKRRLWGHLRNQADRGSH